MNTEGLVEVRVRDCACPDTPHDDGDLVYLRPKVGLEGGIALEGDYSAAREQALAKGKEGAAVRMTELLTRRWIVTCVRYGAVAWNLTGDEGQPLPFDVEYIIDDFALARPVAERASELYTEAALNPLAQRLSALSRPGRTASSTSRRSRSTRKPSARSLRPTSAATRQSTG